MSTDDVPTELPREVLAAWGELPGGSRGPRAELSLEAITATAVELADREGLAAVSMGRVAKALGYTTMSLYRHVANKDELLRHMQDAALGPAPRHLTEGMQWRDGLTVWTRQILLELGRHPWSIEIASSISSGPLMPRSLEWTDWGASLLTDVPLPPIEKLSCLMLLNGYARNEVAMGGGNLREQRRRGTDTMQEELLFQRGFERFATAERLPALHRLVEDGLFPAVDPEMIAGPGDELEYVIDHGLLDFGLQRILDGIEVHIRRHLDAD
ncbi:TetR family transcriptional regulator [Stackebrandtia albiflava]|uniref:TetR family transcriptional regulator n=1 Tax=Stackebrandtia albiflava TaxID=406432 RepID=A0A562VCK2_9ACTN|nr:helix-turn-helix domain-containing protein [Stackebrandtia albiflava]TWJ15592.1 TetR family transcriptional regulator [Stackebrandtia albiflava]